MVANDSLDINSRSHGAFNTYTTSGDLIHNQLIRKNQLVSIRWDGGEYLYHVSSDYKKLVNIDTGEVQNLTDFLNKPIHIKTPAPERVASAQMVYKATATSAKESIGDAISISKIKGIALESESMQTIIREVRDNVSELNPKLRTLLNDVTEVQTRKTIGIDFETAYLKAGQAIENKMVISAGISSVTDYAFDLRGKKGSEFDEIRHRQIRGKEFFNADLINKWVRNPDTLLNNKGLNPDDPIFGKNNFAQFLDSVNQVRIDDLEQRGESGLAKTYRDQVSLVEELKDNPGMHSDKIVARNKELRSYSEKILKKHEAASAQHRKDIIDNKGNHKLARVTKVATVTNVANTSTGLVNSFKNDIMLSDYTVASWAEELISAKKATGGGNLNFVSFSPMESNVIKDAIVELETAKNSGFINNRVVGQYEKKSITGTVNNLKTVLDSVKDVQQLSKLYLKDFLPSIQRIQGSNVSMLDSVLKNMGVNDTVLSGLSGSVGNEVSDIYNKGYSLEYLVKNIQTADKYKEYHLAAADSADLASFVDYFDGIKSDQDLLAQGHKIKALGDGKLVYGITKSKVDVLDLSRKSMLTLNKIQTSSYLNEKLRPMEKRSFFKAAGLNDEFKSLLGSEMGEYARKTEMESLFYKAVDNKTNDFLENIKNSNPGNRIANSKYSVKDPSMLNKIIGRKSIASLGALYIASRMDRYLDSGETITTGHHTSMDTIARRISTTEFGSRIKYGINALKWIGKNWQKNSTKVLGNESWGLKPVTSSLSPEASATLLKTQHPSIAPAWASYMKRKANTGVNITQGALIKESQKGYKPHEFAGQMEDSVIRTLSKPLNSRSVLSNNDFSLIDLKRQVEIPLQGIYSSKHYIPRNTSGVNYAISKEPIENVVAKSIGGHTFKSNSGVGLKTNRFMEYMNSDHPAINQKYIMTKLQQKEMQSHGVKQYKSNVASARITKNINQSMDNSLFNVKLGTTNSSSNVIPVHNNKRIAVNETTIDPSLKHAIGGKQFTYKNDYDSVGNMVSNAKSGDMRRTVAEFNNGIISIVKPSLSIALRPGQIGSFKNSKFVESTGNIPRFMNNKTRRNELLNKTADVVGPQPADQLISVVEPYTKASLPMQNPTYQSTPKRQSTRDDYHGDFTAMQYQSNAGINGPNMYRNTSQSLSNLALSHVS